MKRMAFGAMALAIAAGAASAQLPYATGFEAPGFVPGALNGQNGWVEINGGTGAITNNIAIVNNAANAYAGSQYATTTTSTTSWGGFTSNTSRYAFAEFPDPAGSVDASCRVRVGTPTGSMLSGGGVFMFSTATNPGDTLVAGMRQLTNGQLQLFNGAGNGIGFAADPVNYPLNAYNEMRMVANMAAGTIDYYINGIYLNPFLGTFSATFATGTTFNDFDLYAVRGTSGTGGSEIRWDEFSVTPAPGALALLGIGGLVASRRRR